MPLHRSTAMSLWKNSHTATLLCWPTFATRLNQHLNSAKV
ncbi:hypothetical protein X011_08400 [Mycobacterium tuberculosis variant microti OV254]|nr:hypothetical protein X011_08400 [Mycobacterium tuberculosis variant microti OV254]